MVGTLVVAVVVAIAVAVPTTVPTSVPVCIDAIAIGDHCFCRLDHCLWKLIIAECKLIAKIDSRQPPKVGKLCQVILKL